MSTTEAIPTPEELRHRIEAFRQKHVERTKQPLDEGDAVRLLVLRGLAAFDVERTCPKCGEPFPPGKRTHAVWCSKSCGAAVRGARRGAAKGEGTRVAPCP